MAGELNARVILEIVALAITLLLLLHISLKLDPAVVKVAKE